MYSLSYLYQAMGDVNFADHCERAAFNALPVMLTSDHWAHQYLVLANQPFSYKLKGPNPFWNTNDDSIIYGLGKRNFETLAGLLVNSADSRQSPTTPAAQ